MPATLPKEERLHGKSRIAALLKGGKWGSTPHLRYCCLRGNGLEYNRMMVSVPKKSFKRAVKRNFLKRRIREAYRTQKQLLETTGCDILFFYAAATLADSAVIRAEVADILQRLSR
ncbi:MAG: ribonuclease P protein component [Bacteroidales bacterium]|nr:ribonuclease P protein component [Bacteroidales bacterium]